MKQNKGYVARARGDAVAQQNCHSASNGGAFLTNGTGVMVATKCSSSRDKAGYIVPGNTGVSGQDSGVELLKVLRVGVFPEGCCILWPGRAQGQAPLCCSVARSGDRAWLILKYTTLIAQCTEAQKHRTWSCEFTGRQLAAYGRTQWAVLTQRASLIFQPV